MSVRYYLRNTKTNKRFQIVRRNKAAGTITLKGDIAEFEEQYDMEKFKKQGYVLEAEELEEEDA